MNAFTLSRLDELSPDESRSQDPDAGFGIVVTSHGNLPMQQLNYHSRVVGLCARTTIWQTFYNPFNQPIEANYVFPLVGNSAVVGCVMRVEDRTVVATLKERQQARNDYELALAQGYRASLLQENRSETFSMKVGNIAPGEAIMTCLETVAALPVVGGQWTLRLPLVVAPRYTSGFPLPRRAINPNGHQDTDQAPDASTVTPPTLLPGFLSPIDLKLTVDLDLGGLTPHESGAEIPWYQSLKSSLHTVVVDPDANRSACRIRLHPGEKVNRDFILRGKCARRDMTSSLVIEQPADQDNRQSELATFAINVVAPLSESDVPRDIVFVLDRSGSMSGWKMDAAIDGVSGLLGSLREQDRFALLAFDNQIEQYSAGRWQPQIFHAGKPSNLEKASRWLQQIRSRGGTEMGTALAAACECFQREPKATQQARAIVLLTDGQITGEDSVLRMLAAIPESHRPQVFSLGIDRSVNASVLQRISDFTGGTFELAETVQRLREVLNRFASEIGRPAISKLAVESEDPAGQLHDVTVGHRTSVFPGRVATIYGRLSSTSASPEITLSGVLADGSLWQRSLQPSRVIRPRSPADRLLHPSWARRHLRQMEDRYVMMDNPSCELADQIVRCSLESNVLSRMTAYVAVDDSAITPSHGKLHRVTQPVSLPEGWDSHACGCISSDDLIPIPGQERRIFRGKVPNRQTTDDAFEREIVRRGIVSKEQLLDAQNVASETNRHIGETLVIMGYATGHEVAQVKAGIHQTAFVDLQSTQIPESVIELVPESVARENSVLPLHESAGELTILMSDPADVETIEKLRFILNRRIQVMVAAQTDIEDAINHYYGLVQGESADSMLQEFTDTAIDFTETSADDSHIEIATKGTIDASLDEDEPMFHAFRLHSVQPASTLREDRSSLAPPPYVDDDWTEEELMEAPVVRRVNLIIAEAVLLRASHVFLRRGDQAIEIEFLVDGELRRHNNAPYMQWTAIANRLRILAKIDLNLRDQLQVGTVNITVGDRSLSLGVAISPVDRHASILLDLTPQGTAQPDCVEEWWTRWKTL